MERVKEYAIHLITGTTIPLMMIFYPEKIEPVFKFVAGEYGIYFRVSLYNLVMLLLYKNLKPSFRSPPVKRPWKPHFRNLIIFISAVGTMYLLEVNTLKSFKYAFASSFLFVFSVYGVMHLYAKKT